MHAGQLVFAQLMDFLSRYEFNRCVQRYGGNRRVRRFRCWDQFLVLAFAQLTFRESLRDIEICLRSRPQQLYHMGIRSPVARSTLAEANEHRDWRIWADLAQSLIAEARQFQADANVGLPVQASSYAFDATVMDLCLTLFPWAQFRRNKSAVKMHTLLDLRGAIPCFIRITAGSVHEVNLLDELPLEAGAYYMMDRGFIDFARLYRFTESRAFFVTRAKAHLDYQVRESRPVDLATGLRADQSIRLAGPLTRQHYPELLRRISFTEVESGKNLVFLSNNFRLAASTICRLYQCRWQVEVFFKWIKQNLRIKAFFGTSVNAVKTQLWIAIAVYVLLAIIRKRLDLSCSMAEMVQILSLALFEKTPILQVFTEAKMTNQQLDGANSLPLFNL